MRYYELPDSPIQYYIFKGGRGALPKQEVFIPTTRQDIRKAFSDPMSFIWYMIKLRRAQLRVFYSDRPDAIKYVLYRYYKLLKGEFYNYE